ncbi:serine acetyltransferase [Micrococcaceae bacterium Sec5.7]
MKANIETGYWREDRIRYGRMAWLVQPSYWAVMVYRFGRWTKLTDHPLRKPAHATYFLAYSFTRLMTGIDIPRGAAIGPGLLIHHFGGIIINPRAVVGANCTMRQGVTIGTKYDGGGCPVLADNVVLGAYAQVLGDVKIGTDVTVGAMSLVMTDIPSGSTAVGVPAKILDRRA